MAFFVSIALSVLNESFLRRFAGHSNIQTLQNSVELWISFSETSVFSKDLLAQLDNINPVYPSARHTG